MIVDNSDMGQNRLALGVVDNHKVAGLQIDLVERAEPSRMGHRPAFENQTESRVQPGVQNQVEGVKQPPFDYLVEQRQTDVPECWPSGQKDDLVDIEVGPFSQKGERAGAGMALPQLRVALVGREANWAGQLVDLMEYEVDHHVEMLECTGRWVGSAEH